MSISDYLYKYSLHLFGFLSFCILVLMLVAVLQVVRTPAQFSPPFLMVPDETGLVTDEGFPIYATTKETYEIGEVIHYDIYAVIGRIPYVLHPNFTLVTAEDDSRIDVCHFQGIEGYPRNITRTFDEPLRLHSTRNLAMCFPTPPPGKYYVEAIIDADESRGTAYLAGPFELEIGVDSSNFDDR